MVTWPGREPITLIHAESCFFEKALHSDVNKIMDELQIQLE